MFVIATRLLQVETYYPDDSTTYIRLKRFDLVLSVIFAAEWAFWLWLSRDKIRYIFSIQSLVDVVTILPIFVSYFVSEKVMQGASIVPAQHSTAGWHRWRWRKCQTSAAGFCTLPCSSSSLDVSTTAVAA